MLTGPGEEPILRGPGPEVQQVLQGGQEKPHTRCLFLMAQAAELAVDPPRCPFMAPAPGSGERPYSRQEQNMTILLITIYVQPF